MRTRSPRRPKRRSGNPRWQRRPDARPEEILVAALHVFGEHGFARARLEDVARRAGVSKGTLYLYFPSKEELFRAMVRARVVTTLAAAEQRIDAHSGTAREQLVSLAQSMWQTIRKDEMARISRLVQFELGNFPELARFYFQEVITRARRLVETILRRGIEAGEFRPVNARFAARMLPSMLVHSSQAQCFFAKFEPEPLTDEQIIDGVVDLYLNGVVATGKTD